MITNLVDNVREYFFYRFLLIEFNRVWINNNTLYNGEFDPGSG
jgi:hypothetical protein